MQEEIMGNKGRHNEKKPKQDKTKKEEPKKTSKWNYIIHICFCQSVGDCLVTISHHWGSFWTHGQADIANGLLINLQVWRTIQTYHQVSIYCVLMLTIKLIYVQALSICIRIFTYKY